MPLTDLAALREQVMTLLASAPLTPAHSAPDTPGSGPEAPSLIDAPAPVLNAAPRSFADVYGADGDLLAQLSREAATAGEADLAALLLTLNQRLRAGELDLTGGPEVAPRLVRFVYPVV